MSEVQARVHELDEKLAQAQTEAKKSSPDLVKQLAAERERVAEQLDHMLKEQAQSAQINQAVLASLGEADTERQRALGLMNASVHDLKESRAAAGARGQFGGLTIYEP
jgi:hypothetical protein